MTEDSKQGPLDDLDALLEKIKADTEDKKRILVVDDDPSYRQFIREWLKADYSVSLANGGEQALKLLQTAHCDLILLDCEMPVLSGPQTLARIRELPQSKDVPVLFLTGRDDDAVVRELLSLHPAGYLLKTTSRGELLLRVKSILSGR